MGDEIQWSVAWHAPGGGARGTLRGDLVYCARTYTVQGGELKWRLSLCNLLLLVMVVIIGWRGGGRPGALPSPLSGWTRAIIERRRSPTDNIMKD